MRRSLLLFGLGVAWMACGGSVDVAGGPSATTSSSSSGAGGGGTGGAGVAGAAPDVATFLATIELPGAVAGMAYDATAHELWVSTQDPTTSMSTGLVAVDGTTDEVSAPIVTTAVGDVAVLPALGKVYVAHSSAVGDAVVTVFDEATKAEKSTITAAKAGGADWIAADHVRNRVFVFTDPFATPTNQSSIVVIDGKTDAVVATVPVGTNAFTGLGVAKQIDVSTPDGKVWVVGGGNGTPVKVVEFDQATNTVTMTTTVASKGNPNGIAAMLSDAAVVVHDVATGAGTLSLVGPLTVALPAGFVPYDVDYSSAGPGAIRVWGSFNGTPLVLLCTTPGCNQTGSATVKVGTINPSWTIPTVMGGEPVGSFGQTVYLDMIPDPDMGVPPPEVQKVQLTIGHW
ncbi:MAG TPA: hypothetical protein VF316_00120 [Polyangiaceae bacterium]